MADEDMAGAQEALKETAAGENANGGQAPGEIPEAPGLQKELVEAKDKYLRLFAEFDNMRKRHERERAELIKYAHEEVIIELLGFYEDFERSVTAARANPAEGAALLKGVEMVLKRMQELLKKYEVAEIEALGKKFDHTCHEALMAVDSDEMEDGTVMEVFQKGYIMDGRVVRTAKVKVSKRN
ncbi:MAG: nucleotide exchange factor GrpE [Candidatus Omnitrophica bacterium]|nr:nucleotide exchange factor GrpE [Candidatus Omnitrophota bacterium]